MRNNFIFDGGSIIHKSKKVGWIHINRTTQEIRAEVNIDGRRIIVLGDNMDDAHRKLERSFNSGNTDAD